jgi:hypothetical protein
MIWRGSSASGWFLESLILWTFWVMVIALVYLAAFVALAALLVVGVVLAVGAFRNRGWRERRAARAALDPLSPEADGSRRLALREERDRRRTLRLAAEPAPAEEDAGAHPV